MHRHPVALALLSVAALGVTATAPASAATAPGRVTVDLTSPQPHGSIDPFGFTASASLPDGGVLLASGGSPESVRLSAYTRAGAPDPAFGTGGGADVILINDPTRDLVAEQLLRRPDGRLVLVASAPPTTSNGVPRSQLLGLTAAGAPDPAFHGGKPLVLPLGNAGGRTSAALAADGGVVVTGESTPTPSGTPTSGPISTSWLAARVTAAGELDAGFGTEGVATLSSAFASGVDVAAAPDGGFYVLGREDKASVLRRLTADGKPDAAFARGGAAAISADAYDFGLIARPDGAADVLAGTGTTASLMTVAADGTQTASVPVAKGRFSTQLLAAPDGSELVVAPSWEGFNAGRPSVRVQRIAGGAITSDRTPDAGFAGGLASIFARLRAPGATSLSQSSGGLETGAVRPDGSLLLAGSVAVGQPTGEGAGKIHDQGALLSLTADATQDTSFGGGTEDAKLAVKVSPQRWATAKQRDRLGVRLTTTVSEVGLVHFQVRGRGKLLASSTAPAFQPGKQTLTAYLATAGRKLSSRTKGISVTVTASYRDVLGRTVKTTARGTLR